ncbi:MAG: hypothetical protein K6G56_00950 [Clostridiales bacterium]|nr:hypothetical protein [Clostridiales bacterium]
MKKTVTIVLTLLMLLSIAACSKPGKEASAPTAEPTALNKTAKTGTAAPTAEPAKEPVPTLPAGELPENYGVAVLDGERVLFVSAGDGPREIGYGMEDGGELTGPTAFAVSGGKVFIFDYVNYRILIYDRYGSVEKSVDLRACVHNFCVYENRIYIAFDEPMNDAIYAYDLSTGETERLPFAEGANEGNDLVGITFRTLEDGLEIALGDKCFRLNAQKNEFLYKYEINKVNRGPQDTYKFPDGREVTVDIGANTRSWLLWYSDEYLVLECVKHVNGHSVYERSVRKYNMKGELVGCSVEASELAYVTCGYWIGVTPEGEIYTILLDEAGAHVTKPNLRPAYRSYYDGAEG